MNQTIKYPELAGEIVIPIDSLIQYCGFFDNSSIVNNYYNCLHPEQDDKELDDETGKQVGRCFCHSCPIAQQTYKETNEDERTPYTDEDQMMIVFNQTVKKRIELASSEYAKKYSKIEGWCTVNGMTLSHVSRYRYAKMQFCMDDEEKEAIETHLKDCEPCRELIASIKSDIDRNKLQEIVKTVNEKLQDDVEAKERMDALSKELSDIPYEDLKKKTTVKSDKLGADQDDGKHEADWDEERGKYR